LFVVYSGRGFYKLLKKSAGSKPRLRADPFEDRHSKEGDLPPWRGTLVGADITLDQTAAFSSLLDAIGSTYQAAVRERVKARHKKARFI
jgi:hypothetical protein